MIGTGLWGALNPLLAMILKEISRVGGGPPILDVHAVPQIGEPPKWCFAFGVPLNHPKHTLQNHTQTHMYIRIYTRASPLQTPSQWLPELFARSPAAKEAGVAGNGCHTHRG